MERPDGQFGREALMILVIIVLYSCLCWIPALDTTNAQREMLVRIRHKLRIIFGAQNVERLKFKPDAIENGPSWRYQPSVFIAVLSIQTPAHLYEGHYTAVFVLGVLGLSLLYATLKGSFHHIRDVGRLAFMASLVFALLTYRREPGDVPPTVLFRAIRTRALSCMTLTERLDEAVFQFAVLTWLAYYLVNELTMVPIYVLFLCIIPLHIFGLREWLASLHTLGDNYFFTRNKAEVIASLLPVLAFMLESPRDITPVNSLFFAGIFFGTALGLFFGKKKLDKLLMGLTLEEDKRDATIQAGHKGFKRRDWIRGRELIDLIMTLLTTHGACALNIISFIALLGAIEVPVPWILVASLIMTIPLIYLEVLTEQRIVSFSFQVFLLVCMRMTCVNDCANVELPFVLAMTSRAFRTIMNRSSFCWTQAEALLLFALASYFFGSTRLFRFTASLITISLGEGLMITLARERPLEILKREHDADAFLAHQLKQKYCAVSSVLEQCIEKIDAQLHSAAPRNHNQSGINQAEYDELVNALEPIRFYLNTCFRECSKGHEECHAVNVVRNLRRRVFATLFAENSYKSVAYRPKFEILSWISRGIVDGYLIHIDPNLSDDVVLTTYWEGLKAFVLMFAARRANIIITYDKVTCKLAFRFVTHRRISTEDLENLVAVVRALGGSLLNDEFGFVLQCSQEEEHVNHHENADIMAARDLSVAVLDDSELIRRHLQKTLESAGVASKESSIYRGATLQECIDFPGDVVRDNRFDLVIVDENLFEGLSGSLLGVKLRRLGYNGCLLLHSAMAESTESQHAELAEVFDGFLDKSTSRKDLIRAVTRAFVVSQEKRQRNPN